MCWWDSHLLRVVGRQIKDHIITLAGIAYLILKSEVYGLIQGPYIQTYAHEVMSFLEASGRRLGPLDESMFQDMFDWLERCLEKTTALIL